MHWQSYESWAPSRTNELSSGASFGRTLERKTEGSVGLLGQLHGAIAAIVILSLLFADEAGLPLPVAPNEVLLILAGVLIQAGGLHAWIFFPAAALVMSAGTAAGYSWARIVGERGLESLARRLGAERVHTKVRERLRSAGPIGIGVARMLPGVRPWATLVSGATGVKVRTFALGALPALLLWEVGWTVLGIIIGVPAVHYLGVFERLILRGVLLLVLGIAAHSIIRRFRTEGVLALRSRGVQVPLVGIVLGGSIACVTLGLLSIGRGVIHVRHHAWVDLLFVLAVLAIAGVIAFIRDLPLRAGRSAATGPR